MDKELLDALDNLSVSLQMLSDSLGKKSDAKTDVGSAMQSGNFGKQIQELSNGIKSIKEDTSKILDNTETIIKLQKENNDRKFSILEGVGKGGNRKMLKDGISIIVLIAGAVLAIGTAFKLIGDVDWLSVISLSISLPLIAMAIEKISKSGITIGDAFVASGVMIVASLGIVASSYILGMVKPVGLFQLMTAAGIAYAFSFIAPAIGAMINGLLTKTSVSFEGVTVDKQSLEMDTIIKGLLLVPLVMIASSLGITAASYILSNVKPIGAMQAFTAVLIAVAFGAMAYGIGALINGLKDINPATAIAAGVVIPVVMIALSYAIVQASWLFGSIKPIGIFQALTAILVSAVFVVLAYAVKPLLEGVKGVGVKELALGGLVIVGLTYAIVEASKFLVGFEPIPFGNLINFVFSSIAFAVSIVVMAVAVKVVNTLGTIDKYIEGGLSIVIVAATIALSSQIIGLGDYSKYPSVDWSLGVGLSLLGFGLSMLALGFVVMSGVGFVALLAGIPAMLGVAGTIVAVDAIVSAGSYSKYPGLDWSLGVGGSLLAFSTAIVTLGVINTVGGLASTLTFGVVKNPIEAGSDAIRMVAQSIVDTSFILGKGNYTGGPTKSWAEGIALALMGFSPVYLMLAANKIMSIFGRGVGPEDFATAIRTISQGIVDSANFFNGKDGIFRGGPSKEWAEGVGMSISAFSPVYSVLAKNSGWFKSGVSVDDMKSAIMTISQGIVDAANFFGSNKSSFDISKAPSEAWAKGVGGSISAFAPVFDFVNKNSGWFGADIEDLNEAIMTIAGSITKTSLIFGQGDYSKFPQRDWIDGTIYALDKFAKIIKLANFDDLNGGGFISSISGLFGGKSPLERAVSNVTLLSIAFQKLGTSMNSLSNSIDSLDVEKLSMVKGLTSNVILLSLMDPDVFNDMMDKLEKRGGVFNDLIKDFEEKKEGGTKAKSLRATVSTDKGKSDSQILGEKVDRMTAILADISTVVGSGGTLKSYLNSLKDKQLHSHLNAPSLQRSDKRLKNIIRKIGESASGLSIYLFTYTFNPKVIYQGIIAQELLDTPFQDALVIDKNGFYSVDYSKIDVEFKKVTT